MTGLGPITVGVIELMIGTTLATDVLATAVELNDEAACRAVLATALTIELAPGGNDSAFIPSIRTTRDQLALYLEIKMPGEDELAL